MANKEFEQKVQECLDRICGLTFKYDNRWIYHLDEIQMSVDVENATRDRYNLWNNLFDTEKFLEEHGW